MITPAQELMQVRTIRTAANHAAEVAHLERLYRPTEATAPTMAVPSEAPPMITSATPIRPSAEGSEVKLSTKTPHTKRNTEPAMRALETQCGTLTGGAVL